MKKMLNTPSSGKDDKAGNTINTSNLLTPNYNSTAVIADNNAIQEKDKLDVEDAKKSESTIIENTTEVAENTTKKEVKSDKKSLFDEIAKNIEEDEEKALVEATPNKWSVGPSVAPVYFDAFGEGSPIHSNFASNDKSGNTNLSYGLQVAYEVTDRLSIRSGVHRVDFGYDTNEIGFTSGVNTANSEMIDNINYNQASRMVIVENRPKASPVEFADNALSAEVLADNAQFDGSMVQQMGYVEVPLELSYRLLDKKFGIQVIGGFSSLFLVDNAVQLQSQNLITELGEANNINSTNFSTNIGLGLNYNFSQNLRLNVEPIFKYQLSTFTDTAGSFNPYVLGVYSGLSFRF